MLVSLIPRDCMLGKQDDIVKAANKEDVIVPVVTSVTQEQHSRGQPLAEGMEKLTGTGNHSALPTCLPESSEWVEWHV